MEQLVARWAHNPKVTGSSPVPATQNPLYSTYLGFFFFRGLFARIQYSFLSFQHLFIMWKTQLNFTNPLYRL